MIRMTKKSRVREEHILLQFGCFLVGLHPGSFGDLKICLYNNITPATELVASFIFPPVYAYLRFSLGWIAAACECDGFLSSWVFLYLSSTWGSWAAVALHEVAPAICLASLWANGSDEPRKAIMDSLRHRRPISRCGNRSYLACVLSLALNNISLNPSLICNTFFWDVAGVCGICLRKCLCWKDFFLCASSFVRKGLADSVAYEVV